MANVINAIQTPQVLPQERAPQQTPGNTPEQESGFLEDTVKFVGNALRSTAEFAGGLAGGAFGFPVGAATGAFRGMPDIQDTNQATDRNLELEVGATVGAVIGVIALNAVAPGFGLLAAIPGAMAAVELGRPIAADPSYDNIGVKAGFFKGAEQGLHVGAEAGQKLVDKTIDTAGGWIKKGWEACKKPFEEPPYEVGQKFEYYWI